MSRQNVAGVVLAAGASRRLGQAKQLVAFEGETLLVRAVRLAGEAGLRPVVVVLGAEAKAIRAAVTLGDAVVVENAEWEEGIASSMRAGLRAAVEQAPQSEGVVFLPSDQPRLSADHLRAILTAYRERKVPSIVTSVYAGVRGIPALFPPVVFPMLAVLEGDRGARGMLAAPPCNVIEVAFAGGEVDVDAPEDLEGLG